MAYREVMLSTLDNPFNPFTDYHNWERFDIDNNYNSMSLLDRFAATSPDLPDEVNNQLLEQAIDEICELNMTGNYIKVYENSVETENSPPPPGEGAGV